MAMQFILIFSGNDLANFEAWSAILDAVAGLAKFKNISDFSWSKQIFEKKKKDLQPGRECKTSQDPDSDSTWSLDLRDQGLIRDGGIAVLVRLLPSVASSPTKLDLR